MDNGKLLKQAEEIRKDYVTFNLDQEQEEIILLDRINDMLATIFDDNTITVAYLFSPDKKPKYLWYKLKKTILPKIFPITLLIALTCFLVSEATLFYGDGIASTGAYFKAILTEICFIFISAYRSNNLIEKTMVSLTRVGIVVLMLFVITSETFLNTTKTIENTSILSDKVSAVETQIQAKQKTIDFYLTKGWGVSVNKFENEKIKLEKQLFEMKSEQQGGANIAVSKKLEYKSYGNAFFRFLLLCISMLISRRFFRF